LIGMEGFVCGRNRRRLAEIRGRLCLYSLWVFCCLFTCANSRMYQQIVVQAPTGKGEGNCSSVDGGKGVDWMLSVFEFGLPYGAQFEVYFDGWRCRSEVTRWFQLRGWGRGWMDTFDCLDSSQAHDSCFESCCEAG